MVNAWVFLFPALVFLVVLFGRYRLRIRFLKAGPSLDARVYLLSAGDVVGLDWRSDGKDSSFRLVLFRKAWRISGKKAKSPEEGGVTRDEGSKSPGRDGRRPNLKRSRILFREGWAALEKAVRLFHLEQAAMKLRFGTGDPSTTGILFGFLQTLIPVPKNRFEMDVVPDFIHRKLEGEADLTLRFTMARLVAVGAVVFIRMTLALRQI